MKRIPSSPRKNWQKILEEAGFIYHTPEGKPYWDESKRYELTLAEVDTIEGSTNELLELCAKACEVVIERGWYERLGISERDIPVIERSWNDDHLSIYGRMDLTWDFKGKPKLLEFNADTPTSIFEAAVIQWQWMKDILPDHDQYNSIHEKLIARWPKVANKKQPLYFTCFNDVEDFTQTEYLRDTAMQAGFETRFIGIENIGWNNSLSRFLDLDEQPIDQAFKLYPWEWILEELFAPHVRDGALRMIEPAWKRLLSNKAILAVLWELFPNHPNLLPCYFSHPGTGSGQWIEKPFLSREGANVRVLGPDRQVRIETEGPYDGGGKVYQQYQELPRFENDYLVLGSWVVGEEACGLGLREDSSPITQNMSRFIPHTFTP
jgi:glutathionylspermidine synthase